jgi:hypothetical protein
VTPDQSKSHEWVAMILGAIVASVVPVLVGLFFIESIRAHRPALGRRTWQWLLPTADARTSDSGHLVRLTTIWAAALIGIGLLQFLGAVVAGLSVFDPIGIVVRSALAFVAGALVYGLLAVRYRHLRGTDRG